MDESEKYAPRKSYYESLTKEAFLKYPNNFKEFVEDPDAISLGDSLLAEGLSTGYNYIRKGQYPLPEESGVILYSVYSSRYSHFGEVLANMESLDIVKKENCSFYVRGTKIIGDYSDPEPLASFLNLGGDEQIKTLESVERTVAFYPEDESKAIDIAAYLMRVAPKIAGGYLDPDVRASLDLKDLIGGTGFKTAVANIITLESGSIITLKQKSGIDLENWKKSKTLINSELYQYLVSKWVKP